MINFLILSNDEIAFRAHDCWTIKFLDWNLRLIEWINQINDLIKMKEEDAFILFRIVDKSNECVHEEESLWLRGESTLYAVEVSMKCAVNERKH